MFSNFVWRHGTSGEVGLLVVTVGALSESDLRSQHIVGPDRGDQHSGTGAAVLVHEGTCVAKTQVLCETVDEVFDLLRVGQVVEKFPDCHGDGHR